MEIFNKIFNKGETETDKDGKTIAVETGGIVLDEVNEVKKEPVTVEQENVIKELAKKLDSDPEAGDK